MTASQLDQATVAAREAARDERRTRTYSELRREVARKRRAEARQTFRSLFTRRAT